ncbi:NAD-dependent epimerase/dehydratase family protein [Aspergillus mulundensis]|uniref:NAD-dependent epimerase/dehydratase domain-containing protein n=1 Tax=Aspergillus mulundensis TaxID=1810919 RepID=A0A3D8QV18_9EURO|nr:Uncharacterized protein DSM5745_09442 [Aspergillus mulundensis]RDW65703.1 Uncharacterized protein DSM5745_09442 [Aspergillus mulundensis]
MSRAVLVTGANGYIGNAVARAFTRAGWLTYGLVRSESAARSLELEEIFPVLGQIDDLDSHTSIQSQLPQTLNAIVSTTENLTDYTTHHKNTITLLRTLALSSSANGVKPLVILSSGCKDYGMGPHYDGAQDLKPHTEESPLNPPDLLRNRTTMSLEVLKNTDAFAPVLVRPTNVYGRSASYYRGFFEVASLAQRLNLPLQIPVPANSVCHALHVDDCADAYVALAAHPRRAEIFNISAREYETVGKIAEALVGEYGLAGVEYVDAAHVGAVGKAWPPALIDFPQWTGSEKIRRVTRWRDVRVPFCEGVGVYRRAYERAVDAGHENIRKMVEREGMFRRK